MGNRSRRNRESKRREKTDDKDSPSGRRRQFGPILCAATRPARVESFRLPSMRRRRRSDFYCLASDSVKSILAGRCGSQWIEAFHDVESIQGNFVAVHVAVVPSRGTYPFPRLSTYDPFRCGAYPEAGTADDERWSVELDSVAHSMHYLGDRLHKPLLLLGMEGEQGEQHNGSVRVIDSVDGTTITRLDSAPPQPTAIRSLWTGLSQSTVFVGGRDTSRRPPTAVLHSHPSVFAIQQYDLLEGLGAKTRLPVGSLDGHTADVTGLDFDAEKRLLFSSSLDSTLRFWSFDSREETTKIELGRKTAESVLCIPDRQMVLCGLSGGFVGLWDIRKTKNALLMFKVLTKSRGPLRTMVRIDGSTIVSPDSNLLQTWDFNGKILNSVKCSGIVDSACVVNSTSPREIALDVIPSADQHSKRVAFLIAQEQLCASVRVFETDGTLSGLPYRRCDMGNAPFEGAASSDSLPSRRLEGIVDHAEEDEAGIQELVSETVPPRSVVGRALDDCVMFPRRSAQSHGDVVDAPRELGDGNAGALPLPPSSSPLLSVSSGSVEKDPLPLSGGAHRGVATPPHPPPKEAGDDMISSYASIVATLLRRIGDLSGKRAQLIDVLLSARTALSSSTLRREAHDDRIRRVLPVVLEGLGVRVGDSGEAAGDVGAEEEAEGETVTEGPS